MPAPAAVAGSGTNGTAALWHSGAAVPPVGGGRSVEGVSVRLCECVTSTLAHVALQEADDDGRVVTWLEHVSDDGYGQR